MVVARSARALIYFLLVYLFGRLSLWFYYYLFGSIISLVSSGCSSGCCSVRRRAGNAGYRCTG
jgi:hypothetical protein